MAAKKKPRGQRSTRQIQARKLVAVARKHAQAFLRLPGVTSVGVGEELRDGKPTGRLAIQFTVERKLSGSKLESAGLVELPETIRDDDGNEIPVDVIQRSYRPGYRILDPRKLRARRPESLNVRRSRLEVLVPGISIANWRETAGTLGAVVFDNQTRQPLVLSNWHILHGPDGVIGDAILQPGKFDGGHVPQDVMGQLVRSHLGPAGDCAVCSIEQRAHAPEIYELGVAPARIAEVDLGDFVVKSGRTTGVTHGLVARIGVTVSIDYHGSVGEKEIGGFEIRPDPAHPAPDGEISSGGDSGSLWLIEEDGSPTDIVVGLHFAGEDDPNPTAEHALACNIHSVLEKLDVSF